MKSVGRIVILNGAPRSGKSSIATSIQARSGESWRNIGVDTILATTPVEELPGIGLRPGGERPDIEGIVQRGFADLYESVVEASALGDDVVVDVGHHDSYSRPLGTLRSAAVRLRDLPAWLVGVRCSLESIMNRRDASGGRAYLGTQEGGGIPDAVRRWQVEVHRPGIYDFEVDTSDLTADECSRRILETIAGCPPSALKTIARMDDLPTRA